MSRRIALLAALALGVASGSGCARPADEAAQLALERTLDLGRVSGRIDHLAYDPDHGRLFVAELGNGSVAAVDLATGRVVRAGGFREPQGIAFLPKRNVLVVACGGDGSLHFLEAATLRRIAILALGDDADNVHLDAANGRIVVGYGSGALAVVDPDRHAVLRTVKLPAHPEGFQIDRTGSRAFVNVPGAHIIAALDLDRGRVAATWPAAHGSNFPLALTDAGDRVAIVYRSPSRLALLDARSGAVQQDLPACGDADDLFFDSKRGRIYISCGAGRVDIVQRRGDRYEPAGRVETRPGARTALFVPGPDRLFVAARAGFPAAGAAVLVYRPRP